RDSWIASEALFFQFKPPVAALPSANMLEKSNIPGAVLDGMPPWAFAKPAEGSSPAPPLLEFANSGYINAQPRNWFCPWADGTVAFSFPDFSDTQDGASINAPNPNRVTQ